VGKVEREEIIMGNDHNEFVGPGKVFETEEEEFAEYIDLMEWATQVTEKEFIRFYEALRSYLE
jgi:hypothetical protein